MTDETMIPMSEYKRLAAMYAAEKTTAAQLITELAAEQRRSAEHWRECERLRELTQRAQAELSAMTRQREAAGRMLTEALTELREAREANEWIPVGERLPEDNVFSLITFDYNEEKCVSGGWRDSGWWWVDGYTNDPYTLDTVTHWMPLPEPPEAK